MTYINMDSAANSLRVSDNLTYVDEFDALYDQ
jgi:hypothetical protein